MSRVVVCNYKHVDIIDQRTKPKVYAIDIMQSHGSLLGNPFYNEKNLTRSQRIEKFKVYFEEKMENDERIRDLIFGIVDLYKKGYEIELICACSPKACHGDVIKLWIETMAGGIL